MQQLQHLLDKLELIRLRQESCQPSSSFNIFRLLRPEHDEVHLHSRFIYELLNPKGSHGMGHSFLRLFAETCNATTDTPHFPVLSYDTVQVLREHANIDILIQDRHQAVVIENKIYASDQYEQIKRYHDFAVRSFRTPTLFYLTLDGTPPTEWSRGDLQAEVRCLSYANEIDNWLTSCIKEAAIQPAIRETVIQYQQLIQQLTGKNMNEEEKQQVLALMDKDDNAEQAAIIARNWAHVRWHTEWNFWNELLALANTVYTISSEEKFSEYVIHNNINGTRNKDYTYGILFKIGVINSTDIYFKIERGKEPVYYGLHNPFEEHSPSYTKISTALHSISEGAWESFAGWTYTKAGIDFENFTNTSTLQLANKDKRAAIVNTLWQEIQQFISESTKALHQEFGSRFMPISSKA